MDFDDLRKKIDYRTKMIIISNPHNPGGSAWTREELTELAEICLKRKVLIISDEIHSDLVLPGFKHTVLADISEAYAKQTITMMAPSKTFNLAGMATSSVIISDPDLRDTFNTMLERVHIGMGNIFGAVASEAAYINGAEWRKQLLDYVQINIDYVEQFIQENSPLVKMMKPEATYMIWLDFRELKLSDDKLRNFIIHEAKLGFNDGPVFGPGGEGFQRMNVACPRSIVEEGMKRLDKAVKSLS
jgi:cystathionine beta-lyase